MKNPEHQSCQIWIAAVILSISSAAPAAASKPYDPSGEDLCDGTKAKRKLEFVVSSSAAVPPGISVDAVDSLVDQTSKMAASVAEYLPLRLTTSDVKNEWRAADLSRNQWPYWIHLIRTGDAPMSFVICHQMQCEGLADPVTKKVIEKFGRCRSHGLCEAWGKVGPKGFDPQKEHFDFKRVRFPMFKVDGIDPNVSNFCSLNDGDNELDPYQPDWQWLTALRAAVRDSGLQLGAYAGMFSEKRYLSVPLAERAGLCQEGGQPANCLDPPDAAEPKNAEADGKGSLRGLTSAIMCKGLKEVFSNPANGGSNYKPGCSKLQSELNSATGKAKWTNIAATLLFFQTGTKTSKRVEKDWSITQTTFDPTNFCKYARPVNDFVTH